MLKVKSLNDPISEHFLKSLIFNYVYVPRNIFKDEQEEKNFWFGGLAVGFEITQIYYDFKQDLILNDPKYEYSIIFKDGAGYLLSEKSEVYIVTEEEMKDILVSHAYLKVVEDS